MICNRNPVLDGLPEAPTRQKVAERAIVLKRNFVIIAIMGIDLGREILELLVYFGGDQGGQPSHVAVRFLLPSFFWTVLAVVAFRHWRQIGEKKDRYIGIAAVAGLARELLMFTAEYGSMRGLLSFDSLYPFYPPFEHAATMLSCIFIAAAFINYNLGKTQFSRRYLLLAASLTLIIYMVTAFLWPVYLSSHPRAPFGSFRGDMVFRVAAALFMGTALVVFLQAKMRGVKAQTALLLGFTFLFLDEFLMIFNLASKERHVAIFAPIRHNLHIWAIPLFLGVYWSDLKYSLQKALQDFKQERSRSEAVIAAIGDGISIQDTEFRILYQNQVHRELTGDHWGKLCYQAYEKRDRPCEDCPVTKTMLDGNIHRAERSMELPAGRYYVEITASPLRDAEGRIVAGIEVVRNVTERKRLHHEMAKTEKLESVGLLAGGLAHDFNNLLTAVAGNIGLAAHHLDAGAPGDAYKRLVDAEKASERATCLTRQLLTFSTGGVPIRKTASIIDIIRDSIGFTLTGSNVKARFRFPDAIPPVEVDVGQIHQVFNNLAINAVQAMPNGGVLTVTLGKERITGEPSRLLLPPGDYIRIEVADTGTGIPPDIISKIFEPYFTTKGTGTGLGLATAYSIMKKHDGIITAVSGLGAGAVFHVYLPVSNAKEVPADAGNGDIIRGTGNVLVMDDEPLILDTACAMLKALGYGCAFAKDGAEAVAMYRTARNTKAPYDVVILDLTVPGGIGGREAMQKLLALDPHAVGIVSSGYSNDPVMADHLQYGFKGCIAKPYNAETLGRVIHDTMNNKINSLPHPGFLAE